MYRKSKLTLKNNAHDILKGYSGIFDISTDK